MNSYMFDSISGEWVDFAFWFDLQVFCGIEKTFWGKLIDNIYVVNQIA